jgi:RNA polymerase sigma-70 factor (ECF subfamily)
MKSRALPPARPEQARDVVGKRTLTDGLVSAATEGDPAACQRLLTEIRPMVLRYCWARLGRAETTIGSAEDVTQEICLAVVKALPKYRVSGLSFRAFVYGIAAHKVVDVFRESGHNRTFSMPELPDRPVEQDGPEQYALAREFSERMEELLNALTPAQREILVLRIVNGLSADETGQALGMSAGSVRLTQHRALRALRARITGSEE